MPEDFDPERLQVTREFKNLQAALAIATPRKLAHIAALATAIKASKRGKPKVKG